jgi:hypothetical protein
MKRFTGSKYSPATLRKIGEAQPADALPLSNPAPSTSVEAAMEQQRRYEIAQRHLEQARPRTAAPPQVSVARRWLQVPLDACYRQESEFPHVGAQ